MKVFYRGLLIAAVVVLLLLFVLPMTLKNYAVSNSKELLGRQIEIGKLKYNYFTSTAKVYDFKMFEQNEKDVFTSFDTLIVNIEPYRFLFNEKVVEQFYIKGLMLKTIMKDSLFNFDDLITFHAQDTVPTEDQDAETFKYDISNIELKDSNFFFDNQNVGKETHIEDFSFVIPYIGWNQEEKSNAAIKFNFKNGGYFQSALNINPVDGEFDAAITLKDLYLNPFYEYVLEYAEINDFNGRLNSQIKITGNTYDAINSIVSGHVDIYDFVMTDKNDKAFLSAKKVTTNLKKIDYANSSYIIDSLNVDGSYTFFQLDSVSNNLFRIFKLDQPIDSTQTEVAITQTADSVSVDSAQANEMYYAINHLAIDNGVLDYTDNLTGQPFEYHLSEMVLKSDSISSDKDWVNLYSDMLLNDRGTLHAELGFNPLDLMNAKLDLTIEKFLLSDINIYAKHYTGHSILLGDFYYYSNSTITNGDIISENKLMVKNVSVENTKGGLFSLPLKFALFLLTDKNGDVNLDIPVRGDLNEPEISIGKIVWTTFKNAIVKTAASPINAIAGLIDGNPKEFEEMTFSYLDSVPSEKQQRKLDKLLELEEKKPGLKIELVHYVDTNLQASAIAMGDDELLETEDKNTKSDETKNMNEIKTGTSIEKSLAKIDSVQSDTVISQSIDTVGLTALADRYNSALIENVNSYLKGINPATQIEAKTSEPQAPENVGSASRFKINYDMLDDSEASPAEQSNDSTNIKP